MPSPGGERRLLVGVAVLAAAGFFLIGLGVLVQRVDHVRGGTNLD